MTLSFFCLHERVLRTLHASGFHEHRDSRTSILRFFNKRKLCSKHRVVLKIVGRLFHAIDSELSLQLFHGSSYRHHPRYYYDDAVVSYGAGRSMLPVSLCTSMMLSCDLCIVHSFGECECRRLYSNFDQLELPPCSQDVVLRVPMETMKDVERVKQALTFEGMNHFSPPLF